MYSFFRFLVHSISSPCIKTGIASIFLLNQTINFVYASDVAQEKYWKSVLSNSVKTGQIIELKTNKNSFIGIYNKHNQIKERGSIVLLHDKEGHPNWKNVIKPLRIDLSDYGWNTLSIQMPIKDKPMLNKEEVNSFYQLGFARINSAIALLKEKKAPIIMLVAYGESTPIALNFVNTQNQGDKKENKIAAIALISASSKNLKQHPENTVELLEKIDLPVLDIYGNADKEIVLNTAKQRHDAAKRGGNKNYLQQQIDHADHFFTNQSNILVKRIHSWLLAQSKK